MDLATLLRKSADLHPEREAVVFEGHRITYSELYRRSCRVANALLALGLHKGDRVLTLG